MQVSDEERRHLEDVYTWIRSDKQCGPDPDKELLHIEEIVCLILQLMGNHRSF